MQFPGEKCFPLSDRTKISVFLRNRGCWFRIWFWFAHKSFSFGDIAIYSNKSVIHFAISSNKINIYLQLNDFIAVLFEEIIKCMSLLFKFNARISETKAFSCKLKTDSESATSILSITLILSTSDNGKYFLPGNCTFAPSEPPWN